MLNFWLAAFVVITGIVTYMGFKEGFDRWYYNYVFSALALFAYLTRRYMMKRVQKHQDFLNNKNK